MVDRRFLHEEGRAVRFFPESEHGKLNAVAIARTPPWASGEIDGVGLLVGPAWEKGRWVQWLTVEDARALADQIHAAADAVELGEGPRTPRKQK